MYAAVICIAFNIFCLSSVVPGEKYTAKTIQAGDTVIWSPNYKLTFEDFKGMPKAEDSTVRIDTSAVSSTGIRYHIKYDRHKMKIQAYAIFLKKQSWIRNKKKDVLEHERGHFDITMIYARKLENMVNSQEIEGKKIKDFFYLLDSSYEKIRLEWKSVQDDFDKQAMTPEGEDTYFKWIQDQLNLLSLR